MTKEEALLIEQEFLYEFVGHHKQFSKFKEKGEYWYSNLAKKYNLKLENNNSFAKLYERKKRQSNPKYQIEYNKKYYAKNKKKIQRRAKKRRQENPEEKKIQDRKHYLKYRQYYVEKAMVRNEKLKFEKKIYARILHQKLKFRKRMKRYNEQKDKQPKESYFDVKSYYRNYNKINKEKIAKQKEKWRQKNKFDIKIYKRIYLIKNKFRKRMLDNDKLI